MNSDLFLKVLPALVELGTALAKRLKGDPAAIIREIHRIKDHGADFAKADAANRAELERVAGKDPLKGAP